MTPRSEVGHQKRNVMTAAEVESATEVFYGHRAESLIKETTLSPAAVRATTLDLRVLTGFSGVDMSSGTTPLCGYCGRPAINNTVWHGGRVFHLDCTRPPAAAEMERLRSEVKRLQSALYFWLPSVPDAAHPLQSIIAEHAYLLFGAEEQPHESAQELGWISLAEGPSSKWTP